MVTLGRSVDNAFEAPNGIDAGPVRPIPCFAAHAGEDIRAVGGVSVPEMAKGRIAGKGATGGKLRFILVFPTLVFFK